MPTRERFTQVLSIGIGGSALGPQFVAQALGGLLDKMPFGAAFGKGLTLKMGQTHVQRYMRPLLQRIQKGEIDPSFVITHRVSLEEAPQAYFTFRDKQEECIKVILKP